MGEKHNKSNCDPAQQFQIGDHVLYQLEGVYATVEGYLWNHTGGTLPRIVAYKLSIGVSVSRDAIIRVTRSQGGGHDQA